MFKMEKIKVDIHDTFTLDRPSDLRLYHAIIEDHYGDDSFTDCLDETWSFWTEITDEQIYHCYSLFSHFEDEEIIYFFPRYMIWTLDKNVGNLLKYDSVSDESMLYWLLLKYKQNKLLDLFTTRQLRIIFSFLKLISCESRYQIIFLGPNIFDFEFYSSKPNILLDKMFTFEKKSTKTKNVIDKIEDMRRELLG